ncbi:hypothetical protein [Niabella drilacis]|uniref:Repeat domain-containing protein n=1 Tax=Niabella drilacis (strain DSM 25811 / CCM 8410 / CCUG 62505 / LMG 26954 / E90) TaxID=1285928 RepID=A0A1G6SPF6_NIADE|nr:hypothetical protein [Niabella drilacis]SDD18045.1 hypothetical protein SAMN04487894_106286 [Niabella drilacis]
MKRLIQLCSLVFLCFLFQKAPAGSTAGNITRRNAPGAGRQDTLPSAFIQKWVLNLADKKCVLRFRYQKNPDDGSLVVTALNESTLFPGSFYKTLEAYFELTPFLSSGADYSEVYERCDATGFTDNSHVSYTKERYGGMTAKALYIYDIDGDGVPEILLADKEGSSADNNIYALYRINKKTNRFVKADRFFNGAFFGWDKTRKYIITGVSDTRERRLVKNKIANRMLVPVKKCTVTASAGRVCF